MNDPIISVAFSVASKKGAYALLLGSGVSRSAEIPTGWEIMLDLISRAAKLTKKDCGADPIGWYREVYGKEPNYSSLLEALARSPEDRNGILRKYFEPTEDERGRGIKMPMPVHKAVAKLVSAGYVRVIVTTNFDRLIEQALQERGITPTVISTPDQAHGALPLAHTNCTVIKVNGDYLDTRIKNTSAELGSYDQPINVLLDRVFDEYGLIICGWSATWDTALCAALERCQNHRFTTFWCKRANLEAIASRVANFRLAEQVEIKDADSFFQDLAAKVEAIEQFDKPHPLSPKLASAMLKRYLVHETDRILLRDFVVGETERVSAQLRPKNFPTDTPATQEEFVKRAHRYEGLVEVLLAIVATGCFWGENNQKHLWANSLERAANAMDVFTGLSWWVDLRLYPALLVLYAGGLGAVANSKYSALAELFAKPRYKSREGESALIQKLNPAAVIKDFNLANLLLPSDRRVRYWPLNEYLHDHLRPVLRELIPSDVDYEEVFERFEYMFSLVWTDENSKKLSVLGWVPLGRFARKYSVLSNVFFRGEPISKVIESEVEREGEQWPALRAGLFGGSLERFRSAKQRVDGFINQAGPYI